MTSPLHFPIFESRIVTMGRQTLLDRVLAIVDRGVHSFAALLQRLAGFAVRSLTGGLGAEEQKRRAAVLDQAANEIAGVLIVSDFWGRHAVASKARAAGVESGGGMGPPPDEPEVGDEPPHEIRIEVLSGLETELPKIPNAEAIADIVSREPRLAANWREVARAYQDHAFALAGQSDLAVTKRVQQHIAEVLREGLPDVAAVERISELTGFTRARSETILRTNSATAFTGGVFRQAHDSEVAYHFPAFESEAVLDASTTDICRAADGLIAAIHDPVWGVWAPPSHFNCRRSLRMVPRAELEAKGLLTQDGRVRPYYPPGIRTHSPAPGFGQGSPLTRFGMVPL